MNTSIDLDNDSLPGSAIRAPILDACGRVQDLRYINDFTDWAWITRISFPIFLIICTVGNTLGVYVAWKDNKGTKRSFLLCLFITNLLYMWNKLFLFVGTGIWSPPNPEEVYGHFFLMSAGYWMYTDSMLNLACHWIVLVFCLERYLALTNPLQHYARKRKIGVIGTITIIFIACAVSSTYSPILYYWQLDESAVELGTQVRTLPDEFIKWREFDMWFEMFVRTFAYFAIIILDLLIVYRLRNTKKNHANLNASATTATSIVKPGVKDASAAGARRLRASRSVTKTLILSSAFFLFSQALEVIMTILVLCNNPPICSYQITMKFLLIYSPVQVMLSTSYFACSFFVYISPIAYLKSRRQMSSRQLRGSSSTVNHCSTSVLTTGSSC